MKRWVSQPFSSKSRQRQKSAGIWRARKLSNKNRWCIRLKRPCAARENPEFFILARTDAIEPHGLRDALKRGEAYLKAGADGVYFEGPTDLKQLEKIGKEFGKVHFGLNKRETLLRQRGASPNIINFVRISARYFLRGTGHSRPGSRLPRRISFTASKRVRAAFFVSSMKASSLSSASWLVAYGS